MWPFSKPKRPDPAWWREMHDVQDHIEALTARVEMRYAELKALRGLVHKIRSQDDPGDTIAEGSEGVGHPVSGHPDNRSVPQSIRHRIRGW